MATQKRPRSISSASNDTFEKAYSKSDPEPQIHDSDMHLLRDKVATSTGDSWLLLLPLLPDYLRDIIELREEFGVGDVWTCTPGEITPINRIPLTIGQRPVVIPVEYRYPLVAATIPPPDPHPHFIDCSKLVSDDIIDGLFSTFEFARGFYLLINGMLQVIVPEEFDYEHGLSHRPNSFGRLRVSYVCHNMFPTAQEGSAGSASAIQPATPGQLLSTNPWSSLGRKKHSNSVYQPQLNQSSLSRLELGSTIQVRVEKPKVANQNDRFRSKIGLRTRCNDKEYLVISSHVLTQALQASKSECFPGPEWAKEVTVISSDGGEELGNVPQTFDPDARTFPQGFQHDVSLVDVTLVPHLVSSISSPLPAEWLDQVGWNNIRLNEQSLFLLDNRDIGTKSIELVQSQYQMVGQAIFRCHPSSQKQSRFRNKLRRLRKSSEPCPGVRDWSEFVARSVLYRVNHNFPAPGAQSGTAVCILNDTVDSTETAKIAGFSSFAQPVSDIQRFHMEKSMLESRLAEGRIAFYGALQVPDSLRVHQIL